MSAASVFLDTNFFGRLLLNDIPEHVSIVQTAMVQIQNGQLIAETSETVIIELVYLLHKTSSLPKSSVAQGVRAVLAVSNILIPNRASLGDAIAIWDSSPAVSFADAFHLALTASTNHKRIFSFDKALSNRVEGVVRVESLAEIQATL